MLQKFCNRFGSLGTRAFPVWELPQHLQRQTFRGPLTREPLQNQAESDSYPGSYDHRTIQVGKDLRRCLGQPPVQSRSSCEIRQGCSGLHPACLEKTMMATAQSVWTACFNAWLSSWGKAFSFHVVWTSLLPLCLVLPPCTKIQWLPIKPTYLLSTSSILRTGHFLMKKPFPKLGSFFRKFAVSSEPHVFSEICSTLKTDQRCPLSLETEELDKSALGLDMLLVLQIDFT